MTRVYSAYRRIPDGPDPRFDEVEQGVWDQLVQELERFHP